MLLDRARRFGILGFNEWHDVQMSMAELAVFTRRLLTDVRGSIDASAVATMCSAGDGPPDPFILNYDANQPPLWLDYGDSACLIDNGNTPDEIVLRVVWTDDEAPNGCPLISLTALVLKLGEDGRIVSGERLPAAGLSDVPLEDRAKMCAVGEDLFVYLTWVSFTALSLMGSGIAVLESRPLDEKFRKAHIRRHGVVPANREVMRLYNPASGDESKRSLYFVEEHSATYEGSPGHRLFGRFHGTFTVPAHWAGNPEWGISA